MIWEYSTSAASAAEKAAKMKQEKEEEKRLQNETLMAMQTRIENIEVLLQSFRDLRLNNTAKMADSK